MITPEERAYAAGIIDGEGCIRISRRMVKGRRLFALTVTINAVDKRMMDYFSERWGGNVLFRRSIQPNRRDKWTWNLTARKAAVVLEDIYPWLIVKREQAMYARSFQVMMREWNWGSKPRPQSVFDMQFRIYRKMRSLNHRGTAPLLIAA